MAGYKGELQELPAHISIKIVEGRVEGVITFPASSGKPPIVFGGDTSSNGKFVRAVTIDGTKWLLKFETEGFKLVGQLESPDGKKINFVAGNVWGAVVGVGAGLTLIGALIIGGNYLAKRKG